MSKLNEVRIDPKLVPDDVCHALARALLETIRNHPELKEQYERETGKSFYRKK